MFLSLYTSLFFKNFITFEMNKYIIGKKKKHRLRINYQHMLSPGILNPPFPMLLSILLIGSLFCLLPPSLPFPEIFLYSFIYLILIFINLCWRQLSCNCDWKKKIISWSSLRHVLFLPRSINCNIVEGLNVRWAVTDLINLSKLRV